VPHLIAKYMSLEAMVYGHVVPVMGGSGAPVMIVGPLLGQRISFSRGQVWGACGAWGNRCFDAERDELKRMGR